MESQDSLGGLMFHGESALSWVDRGPPGRVGVRFCGGSREGSADNQGRRLLTSGPGFRKDDIWLPRRQSLQTDCQRPRESTASSSAIVYVDDLLLDLGSTSSFSWAGAPHQVNDHVLRAAAIFFNDGAGGGSRTRMGLWPEGF